MSCTCRTASLRIFVQGLSQVHRVDASSSPFLTIRTQLTQSTLYRSQQLATARHARQYHASRQLQQDSQTEGSSAPIESETQSSHQDDNSFSSTHQEERAQDAQPIKQRGKDTFRATRAANDDASKRRGRPPKKPRWRDSVDSETSSYPRNRRVLAGPDDPQQSKTMRDGIPEDPSSESTPQKPKWLIQKEALKEKFPEGWKPRKRLSPDALAGIRALNAQFPEVYTTVALSQKFEVSPEAIRRILKSKWAPSVKEEEDRNSRWHRRGAQIWEQKAALGIKPPQKWRREGITRDPSYHAWRKEAAKRNKEWEKEQDRQYSASLQSRFSGKVL